MWLRQVCAGACVCVFNGAAGIEAVKTVLMRTTPATSLLISLKKLYVCVLLTATNKHMPRRYSYLLHVCMCEIYNSA